MLIQCVFFSFGSIIASIPMSAVPREGECVAVGGCIYRVAGVLWVANAGGPKVHIELQSPSPSLPSY